jgi:hypothetical protein
MSLLVIIATLLPLSAYLVIGVRKASKSKSIGDYFIYSQAVTTQDYANTSIGYALQMAAVFLFAYWGAIYGLGALWTPLFWALGFGLLILLLPRFRGYHSQASPSNGTEALTMHGYIAKVFGAGRNIRWLAAAATIVGLWGTMMAEVDYTIQIFSPMMQAPASQFLLGAIFLIFGLIYILLNGYKAEVNTERTQVPIAYAAFIFVLTAILPSVWLHSGQRAYEIVAVLLGVTFLLLLTGKLMVGLNKAVRDPQILIPIAGIVALIGMSFYVPTLHPGTASSVLSLPLSRQLDAQGMLGLLSLLLANALWMPVDLSTWQRIASVKGKDEVLDVSLKKGTWRILFESPATWMLGVALGICISAGGFLSAGGDPSNGLTLLVGSLSSHSVIGTGQVISWLVYPMFIISSVTIMLSTVHCMISAISFTLYEDIVRSKGRSSLTKAKWWTAAIVLSGIVIYPILRWKYDANLPTFLYGAYSAQLSLIAVAIIALVKRRLNARAATASILFGFAGTIVSVILAVRMPGPDTAVLSPVFAVCASVVGYVLFYPGPGKGAVIV